MGVDTEIFTSYGFLVSVKLGLYIESCYRLYHDYDYISFTSDGYDMKRGQMFIHITNTKQFLFDRRTGGHAGFGNIMCKTATIYPTCEQKEQMDTFILWVNNLKQNNEYSKYDLYGELDDICVDHHIYYRNW